MVRKAFYKKRGWTRVIEVFVAVMLLMGVLTVILQQQEIESENRFKEIYEKQHSVTKEIQMNQSMRSSIISGQITKEINSTIEKRLKEMECKPKICTMDQECQIQNNIEEEIYAQTTKIYSNTTHYKPKKIKIFCW